MKYIKPELIEEIIELVDDICLTSGETADPDEAQEIDDEGVIG